MMLVKTGCLWSRNQCQYTLRCPCYLLLIDLLFRMCFIWATAQCCINLVSLNMTPQQKKRHLYTIKHAMTFKYNIPHNAICHETPAPNLALPFLYTRPTLSPTNPMDQETANALFEQGACLLFLEAPPNLEFGIDYNAWTIGPLFKGVKMIPPGLHFVYFS